MSAGPVFARGTSYPGTRCMAGRLSAMVYVHGCRRSGIQMGHARAAKSLLRSTESLLSISALQRHASALLILAALTLACSDLTGAGELRVGSRGDSVEVILAQSAAGPSLEEINNEIQELAAKDNVTTVIPEQAIRRWLPSDDLDENAATLRSLGFEVEVHDVESGRDDPDGTYTSARLQGKRKFFVARKIVRSGTAYYVHEGRIVEVGWAVSALMSGSVNHSGQRAVSGRFGTEAAPLN